MFIVNHLASPLTLMNSTTRAAMSIEDKQRTVLALSVLAGSSALAISYVAAPVALVGTFYCLAAKYKWDKLSEVNAHPLHITIRELGQQRLVTGKSYAYFQHFVRQNTRGEVQFDIQEVIRRALSVADSQTFFDAAIDQLVQMKRISWTFGETIKQKFQEVLRLSGLVAPWSGWWSKAMNPFVKLALETKAACRRGFLLGGQTVRLDAAKTREMQKGTQILVPRPLNQAGNHSTRVRVYNQDTFKVAKELQDRGLRPVALDMANENTPGGGFERGCRAQEEDLFCRSNYFQSLYRSENITLLLQSWFGYHIPEKGVIYSPSVQVFRGTQDEGYAFCQPYSVDMIACAAYNRNRRKFNAPKADGAYVAGMKDKMRATLRTAILTGHDAVVLGAMGCGAFHNDPRRVAGFFRDVLKEPEFKGQFKEVAFAVIDDRNGKNFKPFHSALNGLWV